MGGSYSELLTIFFYFKGYQAELCTQNDWKKNYKKTYWTALALPVFKLCFIFCLRKFYLSKVHYRERLQGRFSDNLTIWYLKSNRWAGTPTKRHARRSGNLTSFEDGGKPTQSNVAEAFVTRTDLTCLRLKILTTGCRFLLVFLTYIHTYM